MYESMYSTAKKLLIISQRILKTINPKRKTKDAVVIFPPVATL